MVDAAAASRPHPGPDVQVRDASSEDLTRIFALRHEVYAEELGQHPTNAGGCLTDDLDGHNHYLVAAAGDDLVGFVSLTPPWVGRFGLDKHLTRAELPVLEQPDVFEVRILTVAPDRRWAGVATLLMYAALRWVATHGGRTIVAMGRTDLVEVYAAVGLVPTGRTVVSGAVSFEVMTATVDELTARARGRHADVVRRWGEEVDWRLDAPLQAPRDGCEHGGASLAAGGTDPRGAAGREQVVGADVLDAWFDPAPGVRELLARDPGWLSRTSPPAGADGLVAEVAARRGLPSDAVVVGAGSSDLIYRLLGQWLTPRSRVLLLDPTYGEYAHVAERVVGCHVDRLRLQRERGWEVDLEQLADTVARGRYDLVVVVNPNNPTGRHVGATGLRRVVAGSPEGTRWWIDEAYLGYVDLGESLADLAAVDPRVVVCSSLSKIYALSGLRAAYAVAEPSVAAGVRRRTPPWQVSLPTQLAAVAALGDPAYYEACWRRTHELRRELVDGLRSLGGSEVEEGVANSVNLVLPHGGLGAAGLVRRCRDRGVYLRDLSALSPQHEGRTVRVAVRDVEENARIVEACSAVLSAGRR